METLLSESVLIDEQLLEQWNELNAFSDCLNTGILHSVSSNWKSFQIWGAFKSLSNFFCSKCSQTTIINQEYFKFLSLLQKVKKWLGSIWIYCVIADIKLEQVFTNQAFGDVFNRLRNFLFQSRDENIVDIEVINLFHEFEFLTQCLTENFRVRVSLNLDDFDLMEFIFLFLEFLKKFMLEIIDLDLLGNDWDGMVLSVI